MRNSKTGRILKQTPRREGYLRVHLCDSGSCETKNTHRLVAFAFSKNPKADLEVNHIDGTKTNNKADNLEFVTPSENVTHAFKTGLRKRPPTSGTKPKPVINLDSGEEFPSVSDAARSVGVTKQAVGYGLRTGGLVKGIHFKYAE